MISPSLHLDPEDRSGSSSSPSSWGSRDPVRSQVSGVLWVAEHRPRGEETGSTGGPRPYAAEGRELSSQPAGPLPGRAAFPSQSSVALRSHSTTRTRLKSLHAAPCPLALPSEYPGSPSIYRPPDPRPNPFSLLLLPILAPFTFGSPTTALLCGPSCPPTGHCALRAAKLVYLLEG